MKINIKSLIKRFRFPKIKLPRIKITDKHIQLTGVTVGFFMVFRGLWLISEPLALILCGLSLMWVFWPGSR